MWDGDQLLYELRGQGGNGATDAQLNTAVGAGYDYGKVGYVHAGAASGIDAPLVLMDGRVPNYNWRGLPESSVWLDGSAADCAIGTGTCTTIRWPGNQGVYMKPGGPGASTSGNPAQWVGSLMANGVGSTGMAYRRNRFYDGATGQFNQQDPIGLAGGANSYGFAGGDPVNHSDPFGLFATSCCVLPLPGVLPPPPPIPQEVTNAAARAAESAAAAVSDAVDALRDKIQYRVVTYTRTAPNGQVYSGRTSGFGDPQSIVEARARNHPERLSGFGPPVYDKWAPWSPQAYVAIRGREQQLIDAHGRAQSEGGTSANIRREVNRTVSPIFEAAATAMFGPPPPPAP